MQPRQIKAKLFHRNTCILGEGPFWFDDKLWWVDIEAGLLLAANANGKLIHRFSMDQRIGTAAPIDSKNFIVALEHHLARFNLDLQSFETLACPKIPEKSRFNDGKCDPRGRFLAGTMSMNGKKGTSALYSLEKSQPHRLLRKGASISNGLAWSGHGKTMYYIDTPQLCVFGFNYNLETGSISRERVILKFLKKDGWPDGMTIDCEDNLWISFWNAGTVRCYSPFEKKCLTEIRVPCTLSTSCCFGGPQRNRLFITTARVGLSKKELSQQPLAGSIFVCDLDTKGLPTNKFL